MTTAAAGWHQAPDMVERVLRAALERRDWRGVEAALTLLALTDPRRAEKTYQTMRAGLWLTEKTRQGEADG